MFEDLYSEPIPGISGGRTQARHLGTVTEPIKKPKALGPETSWSYFHPSRVDARFPPTDFRARVHAIDPNLEIVWHPIHERWTVWVKNPRITNWKCAGWQLLFPLKAGDGSFMPLDERVFALIHDRSPRKWGNAKKYFDRILDEVRRDYKAGQRNREDLVGAIARDKWSSFQIKNIGHGSKFALHHSGN